MAHGSDGGVDVVRNVRPGHVMPTGADPDNTEGFARWVNSIHPAFIQDGLADKLVEEGYDRVSMAAGITVDVLRNQFAVKMGHAVAFVAAAKAVQVTLGYDEEAAEVVDPMRGGRNELPTLPPPTATPVAERRRTAVPKVPTAAAGAAGCGQGGMGTVAAIQAWVVRLTSWARSEWGADTAHAIAAIARDTELPIDFLTVSDEFEVALHSGLLHDLPDEAITYLGDSATGSSGLKVLQMMLHPVLGAQGHSAQQQALQKYESYPTCTSKAALHGWLQGFQAHCTLLQQSGEVISKAQQEQKVISCCKEIPGWSADIKAARMGARGAGQDFRFMEFVQLLAVEAAPEASKAPKMTNAAKKKALAAVATAAAAAAAAAAGDQDDEDEDEQYEESWSQVATPKGGKGKGRRKKKGKGGTATPAVGTSAEATAPKNMCREYWATGQCSRSLHGYCTFHHFTPDQVDMKPGGFWAPKPGTLTPTQPVKMNSQTRANSAAMLFQPRH